LELVANALLLDTYRSIAKSQYEVIQKQEEASKAGMKEIRRLREELEQSKKEVQYWKEMFAISRCTIDKFDGQLKAVKAALE
jgi:hypothetical protein